MARSDMRSGAWRQSAFMTGARSSVIARALLMLFAFNVLVARAAARPPIVGVLEDVPGVYVGQTNIREVRVTFQKSGEGWVTFPSACRDQTCLKTAPREFPHKVTWSIGFHGRLLGKATGRTPNDFKFYSHVGLQEITSQRPLPRIGTRSTKFGGYAGVSVYRPLVANSEPYFTDPDGWKPIRLASREVQLFRREFRQRFPELCKRSVDETKVEPFRYREQDVQVVRAYASREHSKIARLHVQGAIDCNKNAGVGLQMDDPWFALDAQRKFHYLDSGMWMVDAGDYDNDGASELIFSIDRENRGGYVLFYDDFRRRAIFEFEYH